MARSAPAPEVPEVVPTADPLMAGEKAHQSLIDRMKQHFAAEERVEVKILGDKKDGDVFVQINGYSFLIQRGSRVRVPASVAVLLEQGEYI